MSCVGVQGCSGYQVCKSDGTYDSCVCGPLDDGSIGDSSSGESGYEAATDVAAEAADGAPWSPANLPGLALWMNDDVGLVQDAQQPGYVKHWLDQSGNGNDATAQGGCSTCEPGYDPAAIHGHDAIMCNTGYMQIADAPSLQFGTGDYAIAMVAKLGVPPANDYHGYYWRKFDLQTSYGLQLDVQVNTSTLSFTDYDKSVSFDISSYSGKWEVVLIRGQAMEADVGSDKYTGPTPTYDVSAVGVDPVFCEVDGNVEIAEVVAVKGMLAVSDQSALQSYFTTKFGL